MSYLLVSQALSAAIYACCLNEYSIWAKIHAAAADPTINTVFLGNSRVHLGISPAAFDQRMAERSHDLRSFNIASDGLSIIEAQSVLETLLDRACCIKYVITEFDPAAWGPMGNTRSIRGRTSLNLTNALRYAQWFQYVGFVPSPPSFELHEIYANIAIGTALHYSNAGILPFLFEKWRAGLPLQWDRSLRGWDRVEPRWFDKLTPEQLRFYSDALASTPGPWPDDYAANPLLANASDVIPDREFQLILSLAAYVRSKGAELILLRTPMTGFWNVENVLVVKHRAWCNDIPLLLDYGVPKQNSVLYDANMRYDNDHLNQNGAILFSRMIADRLADAIETNRVPSKLPICGNRLMAQ